MIKKLLSLLFVIILLTSTLSITAFAADQEKAVYDIAGLFTEDEKSEMEVAVKEYFAATDFYVYIVTAPSISGDVEYWGDHFIDDNLNGTEGNFIILIITDNYDRNYDLYTYGECLNRISDSEVEYILDDPAVYDNIKSAKNYDKAVNKFIRLSAQACSSTKEEDDAIARKAQLKIAFIVGLISAVIITVITAICIIYSYKKKTRSDKYPLNRFASLELTNSKDIFAGTFITKRVISQGSSKGGSFGGGGGGGHRGGR